MSDPQAIEHLETAACQAHAGRRLSLVALAIVREEDSPVTLALLALTLQDLTRAAPLYQRAFDKALPPGALSGYSPQLRATVELVRAARDFGALDPHAATERLGPLLRVELPEALAVPVVRLAMAAAAAVGDVETLKRALDAAAPHPEALKREMAWFSYLLAKGTGKPDADALLAKAEAAMPSLRAYLEGKRKPGMTGNPAAFANGVANDEVILASVLPGLFRAGGLPVRKAMREAA